MLEVTIPLAIVYFLPSFLAIVRGHQSWWAIVALNLLLGWTALGWIGAFVWSLTTPRWETAIVLTERFYGEAGVQPLQRGLAEH